MENQVKEIKEESEQLLTAFLLELKEENEEFIRKINNLSNEHIEEIKIKEVPVNKAPAIEKQVEQADTELFGAKTYVRMQAVNAYKNDNPQSLEQKELPFDEYVSQLYEEGLSIEEIAKKVKKGKTEIELLLKFQQKRK